MNYMTSRAAQLLEHSSITNKVLPQVTASHQGPSACIGFTFGKLTNVAEFCGSQE